MSNGHPLLIEGEEKKKKYPQIDFVNRVFRLLPSAGLLSTHCSNTVKYIVKDDGGIIGSEYVSYYTVVACSISYILLH